jgi:hypothetical protein
MLPSAATYIFWIKFQITGEQATNARKIFLAIFDSFDEESDKEPERVFETMIRRVLIRDILRDPTEELSLRVCL